MGTTGSAAGFKDSRSLLRFTLASAIPSNAVVTSASLTVRLGKTAPGVTNLWLDLRRVLRPWSENVVTWTNRLSPPAAWSAPGAAAPVDFASAVSQSNLITTVLGPYTFASNAKMVADVQGWVNDSISNFGWILISEIEGAASTQVKFGSREDPNNAPVMTVQFSLPAAPPNLAILPPTNGDFSFSWNTESNRGYVVEYATALPASNWNVLRVLDPAPFDSNAIVTDPLTSSNRFYRVRTQ